MSLNLILLLLFIGFTTGQNTTEAPNAGPEQVHLSWGADETQMIVTWTTQQPTNQTATVEYGQSQMDKNATGTTTKFVDGGKQRRVSYIHRVIVKGLKPDTKYFYSCGSDERWSRKFNFKTRKAGHNWTARFCVYGDLGLVNGRSIGSIRNETHQGHFHAILHVGDFAYNLDTNNGLLGDEFMRKIEPIAAYVPYQALPGNHEQKYNFSNYDNRFTMVNSGSGKRNNHYWSYDVGPVHFIAMSTELYFWPQYYPKYLIEKQYRWLVADLKKANIKENRKKRPWIVVMGHRPLYWHSQTNDILTRGIKTGSRYEFGLEKLFFDQGVDLQIWGHVHNYERFFPMYNHTVMVKSAAAPYKNPKAPVHLVTGSPGNYEKQTPFTEAKLPKYLAKLEYDYGYTRMSVSQTHLKLEQVSVSKKGKVIDQIVITQDHHGPFKKG